MTHRYVLTSKAESELNEILAYSKEHFGTLRTIVLKDKLERILTLLCNNPELGHLREDLTPPSRNFRYHTMMKRFCIVYEPSVEPLRVVRIIHGRMLTAMQIHND